MAIDRKILCGATVDPREIERVSALMPMPLFGAAAPDLKWDGKSDHLLFEIEKVVLGKYLRAMRQTLGTCVSKAMARAVQDTILVQIFKTGLEQWIAEIASEPIYAGSKVEVGRSPGGQGSQNAWAAKFLTDWGCVLRKAYGSIDLTTPDDNLAQRWANTREGVPPEIETASKEHPVKTASRVRSAEELANGYANWYAAAIASDQAFFEVRNKDAVCDPNPRDEWPHSMGGRGVCVLKGGRPIFITQQSWGNNPTGPDIIHLESGREVQLPEGAFGTDWDIVDRMCRNGDVWLLSHAFGWERQVFDYNFG